jgi:hypothetical protein
MEPLWIKVFAITIIECFAPPGKDVCREQEPWIIEVTNYGTCTVLLDALIDYYNQTSHVILVKEPKCEPKAKLVYPEKSEEDIEKGFDETDVFRSQLWKGS